MTKKQLEVSDPVESPKKEPLIIIDFSTPTVKQRLKEIMSASSVGSKSKHKRKKK